MSKKRRPQFKRTKSDPISITVDDIAILRDLDQHRYRRNSDLCRLLPHRSQKHLSSRFRRLYDHQYLDRPRAQQHDYYPGGKPELIYALGNRGAALLAELDGVAATKSNWTDKNRTVRRPHIQHNLLIADVRAAVARLPLFAQTVKVMDADDILSAAPDATKRDPKPWHWQTRVRTRDGSLRPVTTVPDEVFGIDVTADRKRYYYFTECDRGTEPVRRSKHNQTSVVRKFEGYHAGFRSGLHRTRYNIGNLRFLTVTTSQERIQTMLNALSDIIGEGDPSMFLFADQQQLRAAKHILAVPWINGHGSPAGLLD